MRRLAADPKVQAKRKKALRKAQADPQWLLKIRKATSGNPQWQAKNRAHLRKLHASKKHKTHLRKLAAIHKRKWRDPDYRAEGIARLRRAFSDLRLRARRATNARRLWRDPKFRAKMFAARRRVCARA
jgi:hypothetical protein